MFYILMEICVFIYINNKMYLGLHVVCPKFLPDFNQIWIFLTHCYVKPPSPNFTQICTVGAFDYTRE
jgi:hypothetical protein